MSHGRTTSGWAVRDGHDTCPHVARLDIPDIALGQYPRQHVSCRALTFAL